MPDFRLDNTPEETLSQTIINTYSGKFESGFAIEKAIHPPDRPSSTERLHFQQLATTRKHFVLIQLPKKGKGKINLELHKNRLVVVIAVENHSTQTVQKHYAEVYLPETIKLNRATAELGNSLLIITFSKQKPNLLEQALSRFGRSKNLKADRLGYM